MQNKIIISLIALIVIISGVTAFLNSELKKTKADRDVYKQNTDVLLQENKEYMTKDSLHVISVGQLELKLSEYKKYRADDSKLIEGLEVDKKRLESITTAQTKTIYDLKGTVRDSIVYRDNYIIDTLKCIAIADKWFNLNGCSNRKNEFSGTFENRDSLVYVEHVIPKRFLGFLWKYGVKERRQEILSKNPHTKIIGAEYITIRK